MTDMFGDSRQFRHSGPEPPTHVTGLEEGKGSEVPKRGEELILTPPPSKPYHVLQYSACIWHISTLKMKGEKGDFLLCRLSLWLTTNA